MRSLVLSYVVCLFVVCLLDKLTAVMLGGVKLRNNHKNNKPVLNQP